LIPFFYLGAGVAVATAGGSFLICRFDPFVPLFRLSGSFQMLTLGGLLLAVGLFVGRPYCRFLCPYGALLKLAAKVSKWRVRITPNVCTQCRLCEESCPYGAIQVPVSLPAGPQALLLDRRRLAAMLLLTPLLMVAAGWMGSRLGTPASRLNPTVALAERYVREQKNPVPAGPQTAAALAMTRAQQDPQTLLRSAVMIRQRFVWAGWGFGAWVGLVTGVKLVGLSLRQRRTDYEPDRGSCLACARCFADCPNERVRRGLVPEAVRLSREAANPTPMPALTSAGVSPATTTNPS
jgi:ferredoxin